MMHPGGVQCVSSTKWVIEEPSSTLHTRSWEYAELAAYCMLTNLILERGYMTPT